MTLNELKNTLRNVSELGLKFENGESIPQHFHITEIGQVDKKFIDCGGTIRTEKKINLQLWHSIDTWHRLSSEKLLNIINISEQQLNIENHEIEVEYQQSSISKYGLEFDGNVFILKSLNTNCLASDNCGVGVGKAKKELSQLTTNCCSKDSGCC